MRRIAVISILMVFSIGAWAQSLIPVGNAELNEVLLTETVNDQIYSIEYNDRTGEYRLAHFDLIEWNDLGALPSLPKQGKDGADEFYLKDLQYFNGELFLCGAFVHDPGTPRNNVALKWDGNSWTDISDDMVQNSVQLTRYLIYNDQIILVGIFSSGQPVNLLTYNKGTWSPLGDFGTHAIGSNELKDAFIWKGKIYASGIFSRPGTVGNRYLMSFNGYEWRFTANPPFLHENSYFAVHKNHLVLTGTPNAPTVSDYDYFKRFSGKGTTWDDYSRGLKGIKIISVNSMASDGDILWASGTFVDKTAKDTFYLLYNNNDVWHKAETRLKEPHGLGYWNKRAIVFGSFNIQGVQCIASLEEGVAYVQGRVFIDNNRNCVNDKPEPGLGSQKLLLEPGGQIVMTNSDGTFAFSVLKGEYNLTLLPSPFYSSDCGYKVGFKALQNINLSEVDYGMQKVPGKVDLDVFLHDFKGEKVKHGNTEHFVLEVTNTGTQDVSNFAVQIRIEPKNAQATFSIAPTSFVDGVATWDISSLNESETKYIEIDITIPETTEEFNIAYELITDDLGDIIPANNSDSVSYGFYQEDENLQKNSDMGEMMDPKTTELGYDIYFQNTVGKTINKLMVIDTLDRDIRLLNSRRHSYPREEGYEMEHRMQPNGRWLRTLKWTYTTANLPDSAENPSGSVAHFSYDLEIKEGSLQDFAVICNEAQLFIEAFEPQLTNEVCSQVNTTGITTPKLDRLSIYPNPSEGYIQVNNVLDQSIKLTVYSMDGRVVSEFEAGAFETTEFDLSDLRKGVYFISAPGFAAHKLILQ